MENITETQDTFTLIQVQPIFKGSQNLCDCPETDKHLESHQPKAKVTVTYVNDSMSDWTNVIDLCFDCLPHVLAMIQYPA